MLFVIPAFLYNGGMTKVKVTVLVLMLASFSLLSGSDAIPGETLGGYESLLGNTIDQIFENMGAPEGMSVYQGEEDAYGSVVFRYGESLSLFWIDNRVWQVRLGDTILQDESFQLAGTSSEQILHNWGSPYYREDDLLVYALKGTEFPVGCAFYFDDQGTLADLYIFRRDY